MTNRKPMQKEEAPEDLWHLFELPKQNNSSDSSSSPSFQPKLLLLNALLMITAIVKASEKEVEKAIEECYMEHSVVKIQHNRCECMKKNVPW
ncbi:hypothetical protein niasHT_019300 [Heterodera trifolii]|uniref:Uncharacterized protein n=1 Tax=Heterodera trifolii TaxID=157864 RepID=A0ABD2L7M3_9BILA